MAEDFKDLINKEDLDVYHGEAKKTFASGEHSHAPLTIHDAVGGDKTYDGTKPVEVQALKGEDGYSPTMEVESIEGGHRLTVRDKNGTQTVDVMDGAGGGEDMDALLKDVTIKPVSASYISLPAYANGGYVIDTVDFNKVTASGESTKIASMPMPVRLERFGTSNNATPSEVYMLRTRYTTQRVAHDNFATYNEYVDIPITVPFYSLTDKADGTGKTFVFSSWCRPFAGQPSYSANPKIVEFDIPSEDHIKKLIAEGAGGGGSAADERLTSPVKLSGWQDITFEGIAYTNIGDMLALNEDLKLKVEWRAWKDGAGDKKTVACETSTVRFKGAVDNGFTGVSASSQEIVMSADIDGETTARMTATLTATSVGGNYKNGLLHIAVDGASDVDADHIVIESVAVI